ncbi:copper homeostasis protein CutC [Flavobacterium agrisoli]|uniref:PF03932 family protein CutC n=1 Tax=Flavobacterium agrisoli TaxID=2793066 RepID=A0A934PM99_9FLAO|nr:copper homeostasis protein CutC [Flavobacterium agrisoli]MBK0370796.1 copper homeostasis protein CutC [Flavobacterium agrisoli]
MDYSQLEIACFGLYSVALAQRCGVHRIELCDNRELGGITPDVKLIEAARNITTAKLFVMIRPRGGDFVYTDDEFELMEQQISIFKKLGIDGFVFGNLYPDGTIDKMRNSRLIQLAYPLPCTFHRAFDSVPDVKEGLETLIELGFKSVLTSGKAETALAGLPVLEQLVEQAQDRIQIIAGGGIRADTIKPIQNVLGKQIYHSAAILDESDVPSVPEIEGLLHSLTTA